MIEKRKTVRPKRSVREYASDKVAGVLGSWKFVVIQVTFCITWMVVNWWMQKPFDPFPHSILANMLSIEGALAASFILIANNRQSEIDSKRINETLQVSEHMKQDMDNVIEEMKEIREEMT